LQNFPGGYKFWGLKFLVPFADNQQSFYFGLYINEIKLYFHIRNCDANENSSLSDVELMNIQIHLEYVLVLYQSLHFAWLPFVQSEIEALLTK
jgi:hypothetical protein